MTDPATETAFIDGVPLALQWIAVPLGNPGDLRKRGLTSSSCPNHDSYGAAQALLGAALLAARRAHELTADDETTLRERCYERVFAHGSRLLFSTDTGEDDTAPTAAQRIRAGMLPAAGELAVLIVSELCSRQEPTGDDPHLQNLIAEVNNIKWVRGRRITDAHRVQAGMNLVRHTRACGYPEHPLVDVAQIAMKPGLIPAHHLIRRLNQHIRGELHQEAAAAAVHRLCSDEYTTHN